MSNPPIPRGVLARIPLELWTKGILSYLDTLSVVHTVDVIRPGFADTGDKLCLADIVGRQGGCGYSIISHHQAWQGHRTFRVVIVIAVMTLSRSRTGTGVTVEVMMVFWET